MLKHILLFLLSFGFSLNGLGQSDLSSYAAKLDTAKGEERLAILNNLALNYLRRDSNKTIKYWREGFETILKLPIEKETKWRKLNKQLALKSHILDRYGNKKEALFALEEMEVYADSICDYKFKAFWLCKEKAYVFERIGHYLMQIKNYKDAIEYYRKGFNIRNENNWDVSTNIFNIGKAFEGLGQLDSALLYKKMSRVKLLERPSSSEFVSEIDLDIALTYLAANKPDSAFTQISSFIDSCATINNKFCIQIYLLGAKANNELGDFKKAITLLNACKEKVFRYFDLKNQADWFLQMSVSYEGFGKRDSALFFNQQYRVYRDSVPSGGCFGGLPVVNRNSFTSSFKIQIIFLILFGLVLFFLLKWTIKKNT